jgi:hypothetical protein
MEKTYFTKEFLDEKIKDYTDYNGIVLNRIDEINEILHLLTFELPDIIKN